MKLTSHPSNSSFAVDRKSYPSSDSSSEKLKVPSGSSSGPKPVTHGFEDSSFIRVVKGDFNLSDLNLENIPLELKSFFSSLKDKNGNKIPDLFQGGLSEIIQALSGLKKQARGKSLKYIVENLPQSLAPAVDSEEVLDPLASPYTHDPASGKPSENAPVNPGSVTLSPSAASPSVRQVAIPLDPLRASEAGERFRVFVVVLAVLGLGAFFGWDFIVEFLGQLN